MTDFIKEFFHTIDDRLKSKVLGPFLVSFIFWNWKPLILIIASKNDIENTINYIVQCNYFSWKNVLAFPLGISLIYSIVLPFANLALGWLVIWPQGKSIQSHYVLRKKRRVEDVKIAKLDFEVENAKAGKIELEDLNSKIQALSNSNEKYIKENQELRKQDEVRQQENMTLRSDLKVSTFNENTIRRLTEEKVIDEGYHLQALNIELQKGNFLLVGFNEKLLDHLKRKELVIFYQQNSIDLGYAFTDNGRITYINFLQRTRN